MLIDVDLYRRPVKIPATVEGKDFITLSAIDAGPRDALRTIVFLHGFGGRAAYWKYQLEHFAVDNRVIALDQRGHGLSDAPYTQYTVDELADDFHRALEVLQVPENFILIAHSFGGAVGSYFMSKYPGRVEKLVMIASAVRFKLRWGGRTLLDLPTPVLRTVRRVVPIARLYPRSHVISAWNRNSLKEWDGTPYLKRINVPSLVILGQNDLIFKQEAYKEVGELIPGAQTITIPVSAHQVMVERPDAVNRAIDRFIGPAPLSEERNLRKQEAEELRRTRPWLKFYDSRTPYKLDSLISPVQRALEISARRYPHRAALIFYDLPISYRTLERLANRFAHGLKRIGLKPGEKVLILLPNTPQAAIAYYGTLKAGGVAVFSNQHANREELLAQIKDSESVIAVCLSLFYPVLKAVEPESGLRNIVVTSFKEYLGIKDRTLFRILRERQEGHRMPRTGLSQGPLYTFSGLLRRGSTNIPEPAPDVNDLAVIQYTSGTTGAPSGIMLTHKNLASNALQIRHVMPEARAGEEVILGVLPFSHSYGLTGCLNLAPVLGATLVVLPNFVSKEVLEAIARYKPTIFPGVPAMYTKLANFPGVRKYGISSIRACISGGAPLAIEVQEAFEKLTRGRLVEGYGLTEASPVTHANPISGLRKPGSIGIPLPDTEAKIVDLNTGEDVAVGVVGEMLVRGPQVMKGYWKSREDSGRTITPDGWLHTGDIAQMDEDGYFYIIEGKKDMILSGEYNVYPSDIEEVLYEHPKVLDVAVVGTKDAILTNKLKAFVVLRPGERATSEELLEICRQRLESYKIPAAVEFLEELPRNFVGKVLRRTLAEREENKTPVGIRKEDK